MANLKYALGGHNPFWIDVKKEKGDDWKTLGKHWASSKRALEKLMGPGLSEKYYDWIIYEVQS